MDIYIFESGILSTVTGIDYPVDRLWETGDRIFTSRRSVAALRHCSTGWVYEDNCFGVGVSTTNGAAGAVRPGFYGRCHRPGR